MRRRTEHAGAQLAGWARLQGSSRLGSFSCLTSSSRRFFSARWCSTRFCSGAHNYQHTAHRSTQKAQVGVHTPLAGRPTAHRAYSGPKTRERRSMPSRGSPPRPSGCPLVPPREVWGGWAVAEACGPQRDVAVSIARARGCYHADGSPRLTTAPPTVYTLLQYVTFGSDGRRFF